MLLAGDIGGTKTVLALYQDGASPTDPLFEQTYPSGRYDNLEQIVEEFLQFCRQSSQATKTASTAQPKQAVPAEQEPVRRAVFGVAGPVVAGKASLPNLPWVIEEGKLQQRFAFETAKVINDLEAIGHSVPVLPDSDLEVVKEGIAEKQGNLAVLAPGTGLGETFLSREGKRYTVHPSEGGHADFAPVDDLQLGLLDYLLGRFDHVSYERVCSGTGMPNIYAYLRDEGLESEPAWLADQLADSKDPNAVIINAAVDEQRSCPICVQTVEIFVSILAAEAGNMVLRNMATGGMFLGGGIPPRILSFLRKPSFSNTFVSKGRLSRLLEQVPVQVIMNGKAALVGAAGYGLQQTGDS